MINCVAHNVTTSGPMLETENLAEAILFLHENYEQYENIVIWKAVPHQEEYRGGFKQSNVPGKAF